MRQSRCHAVSLVLCLARMLSCPHAVSPMQSHGRALSRPLDLQSDHLTRAIIAMLVWDHKSLFLKTQNTDTYTITHARTVNPPCRSPYVLRPHAHTHTRTHTHTHTYTPGVFTASFRALLLKRTIETPRSKATT